MATFLNVSITGVHLIPGRSIAAAICALALAGCGGGKSSETPRSATSAPAAAAVSAPMARSTAVRSWDCASLLGEKELDAIAGGSGTALRSSVRGDKHPDVPGRTECGYTLPGTRTLGVYVDSGPAVGTSNLRDKAKQAGAETVDAGGVAAQVWQDPKLKTWFGVASVTGAEISVFTGDDKERTRPFVQQVIKTIAARL